jgi:predicted HicB family RNase H-like nuclease
MATGEYTDGKVKVTVRLDPALVKRAKLAAVTRDTTLQALVEQGLRQQLRGTK